MRSKPSYSISARGGCPDTTNPQFVSLFLQQLYSFYSVSPCFSLYFPRRVPRKLLTNSTTSVTSSSLQQVILYFLTLLARCLSILIPRLSELRIRFEHKTLNVHWSKEILPELVGYLISMTGAITKGENTIQKAKNTIQKEARLDEKHD